MSCDRSNQSILKEINTEYSLEGLMLKLQYLATWCKGPTHWKSLYCWERLRAGGEGGGRGWDGWMTSPTQWTWVWASSRRWRRTRKPGMLQAVHGVIKRWMQLSDWTTMTKVQLTSCREALVGVKRWMTKTMERRLWKHWLTSGQMFLRLKGLAWPGKWKWTGSSYLARSTASVLSHTGLGQTDRPAPPATSLCLTQAYSPGCCQDHMCWWFLNKLLGDLWIFSFFQPMLHSHKTNLKLRGKRK